MWTRPSSSAERPDPPDLIVFARSLRAWLEEKASELGRFRTRRPDSIEEAADQERTFHRALHDAGFARFGWPEDAGGFGGSALLRAALYEELAGAGYVIPESFIALEVVAPALLRFAPHLAKACLPAKLRGDEEWCQGFSEPDAGSDLASLRTRAVVDGETFRVNGQKIWTTGGHLARWCALLARTGTPESRHRGLSLLWLDLETDGVTVRPILCASGRNEVAEVFLDDVVVPRANLIGDVDRGWEPLMYLMQFERGGFAWLRQAWLHDRLSATLAGASEVTGATAAAVGEAWLTLSALRERVWRTVVRLAADERLGPATSVDKLLLSGAEQAVFDVIRLLCGPNFEFGDDPDTEALRQDWYFSRIVSIYGGAAEVQRNIIAERVLHLPPSI